MTEGKIDLVGMAVINEPKLDMMIAHLKSVSESLKILADFALLQKHQLDEAARLDRDVEHIKERMHHLRKGPFNDEDKKEFAALRYKLAAKKKSGW